MEIHINNINVKIGKSKRVYKTFEVPISKSGVEWKQALDESIPVGTKVTVSIPNFNLIGVGYAEVYGRYGQGWGNQNVFGSFVNTLTKEYTVGDIKNYDATWIAFSVQTAGVIEEGTLILTLSYMKD